MLSGLHRKGKKNRSCAGFSLVELAIVLLIAGLFISPLAWLYQNQVMEEKLAMQIVKFTEIQENINNFAVNANRYPLPADLFDTPASPTYGQEIAGVIEGCAGWPTTRGVCRSGAGANAVLIGAVPFVALGINPDFAHDYWDNKILYVVTEQQTVGYTPGNGQVILQGYSDNVSQILVNLPNPYDLVLISHGENGRGAYTRNGILIAPCAGSPAALEQENCNMDGVFVLRKYTTATTEISMAASGAGAGFFDDFSQEQDRIPREEWLQSLADPDYALTFADKIGIGTTDPQAPVHVVGRVQADRVLSDNICGGSASGCFNPEIIAGDVSDMDCGVSPGVYRPLLDIANSQVYCGTSVDSGGSPLGGGNAFIFSGFTWVDCAASGQKVTGIDATGAPICNY
ncbi:MAG: hypothetical protein CO093_00420 [Alphaproteobacteria bacterium CG_4_9_14_3_um_filter_47_13]|nr:MAG: hypothetical protein CO093_00420 [Alphaproteobacteria bacterium CG_4_9_14_3_um_filter_47_13]